MKTKHLTKTAVCAGIFAAICTMAALSVPDAAADTPSAPWYSIVPPLMTILLAFLTRNILLSIAAALVTGGLLTTLSSDPAGLHTVLSGLKATVFYPVDTLTSIDNLQILAFVPPIFAMVEIVVVSGGFTAILRKVLPLIKTRKSAQTATALMGLVYFIDDYSNAVIVGSSMRPVTDRFKISREKLAFLVDATSAPITSLAVISTWIVYEVGLFTDTAHTLGIERDGYSMFFDSIVFRFYSLLMLAFVFGHVIFGCDFGPMKKAQDQAKKGPPAHNEPAASAQGSDDTRPTYMFNAIVPLAVLIGVHITGLWIDGGGPAKITGFSSVFQWQYWREVIGSSEHSILILIYAALVSLCLAGLCALWSRVLRLGAIFKCIVVGVKKSLYPCLILIAAWSLKNCCDSLSTDRYLTNLLSGNVPPLIFPAIVFLVAAVTSFATGTSWGTMAIIIPTAVPIAFALDVNTYGLTTVITLGAVLDGAIFGDHCSPISDTTIISSIASRCDHIQHVRTQMPYSLFVAILALVCGYIPAGLGLAPQISFAMAGMVMVLVFLALPRLTQKGSARDGQPSDLNH